MTETAKVCPIWGTPVHEIIKDSGITTVVLSHRAGGNYSIADELLEKNAIEWLDSVSRARLTTQLVKMRNQGEATPHITSEMLKDDNLTTPKPWQDRIDDALLYLAKQAAWPYEEVPFNPRAGEEYPAPEPSEDDRNAYMLMAIMEATEILQVRNALSTLIGDELIRDNGRNGTGYVVTTKGFLAAERIKKTPVGKQCFVAMWFDDSVMPLYKQAIKPAIEDADYTPRRIDQKADIAGKIEDEIIAELRRSSLAIVDFTHDDEGARGSVYYEAGYAHAMNIPTIFTCQQDQIGDIHFDVNHYLVRGWRIDELPKLRKELYEAIRARMS